MTQTFPTLRRQQTHSCKGKTPAEKQIGNASEKGQSMLLLPSTALSPQQGNEITIRRATAAFVTGI